MHTFDPIFIAGSSTLFAAWCLFYALPVFLNVIDRGSETLGRLADKMLVFVFGIAIAWPWTMAVLGHIFRRVPHHVPHAGALNFWLGTLYALAGELWFFRMWNQTENAWLEAGIYCSIFSVIGAILAIGFPYLPLIVLGPVFLFECVTLIGNYRAWRHERGK